MRKTLRNVFLILLLTVVVDREAATAFSPVLPIGGDGPFACLVVEICEGPRTLVMLASAGFTALSVGREILLGAVDSREASAPALSVSARVEGAMDGAAPPNSTVIGVRLPSSCPTGFSVAVFNSGVVESLCKL